MVVVTEFDSASPPCAPEAGAAVDDDDAATARIVVPGGIASAAAARQLARLARAHAGGRLYMTADDGLELRGVAREATTEVLEALPPGAKEARPPCPGHLPSLMEVVVSLPGGTLTSAQLERLAAIAEAYAFGGLCAGGGRLVIWGLDPTLVTEVVAEAQAAGLAAAPARRAAG